MQDKTFYTLSGHPVQPINLEELFNLFASYMKMVKPAPVVYGQEASGLQEHGERVMHEKELGNN